MVYYELFNLIKIYFFFKAKLAFHMIYGSDTEKEIL